MRIPRRNYHSTRRRPKTCRTAEKRAILSTSEREGNTRRIVPYATIAIARGSLCRVVSDAICSEFRLATPWECPAPYATHPRPACHCNFNGGRIASQLREDKPPTLDPATSPEPAVCIRARAFIPVYKTRAPRASTRSLRLPSALAPDAAARARR